MLETVFWTVVNMSITASVAIVLVLAARLLLRRTSKLFSYLLWGLVLFRLLCPLSLPSPVSLLNLLETPAAESGQMTYVGPSETTLLSLRPAPAPVGAARPDGTGAETAARQTPTLCAAASVLWLAGAVALAGVQLWRLFRLRRSLRWALPLGERVYLADAIETPFVLGIVSPKIYLPSSLGETERAHILAHERQHIRRGDPLWKLLGAAALCLHWINPLVWLAFGLACQDMERSCDEAVLRQSPSDIRAAYAETLLRCSAGAEGTFGVPPAFGEREVRGRIAHIMGFRRQSAIAVAGGILVCLTLTACLGFNPEPQTEPIETKLPAAATQTPQESETPPADPEPEPEPVTYVSAYAMDAEELDAYLDLPIGSIMATIDYADEERLVFHYLYGFFVADLQQKTMVHQLDLRTLEVAPDGQGAAVLVVQVDAEGDYAYLTSTGYHEEDYREYRVDLTTGDVEEASPPPETELFSDYGFTSTISVLPGWPSNFYVRSGGSLYYLLFSGDCIGDMQLVVVPEETPDAPEVYQLFGDVAAS